MARDKIDQLIDALNAAIPEIPYGRDAMDLDTPEDWGAVELNGGDGFDADGQTIDTAVRCNLWTVTEDRGSGIMDRVQDVLDAMRAQDDWFGMKWQFPERVWIAKINRVAWKWIVKFPGPLEIEDDGTDGDGTDGDGTDGDGTDGDGTDGGSQDTGSGTEPDGGSQDGGGTDGGSQDTGSGTEPGTGG